MRLSSRMSHHSRQLISATAVVALGLVALAPTGPAAAAPPAPLQLVSPADGSVAADADPHLKVIASDPDGGPLQVTFEGRKKGESTGGTSAGEPFTVVALPDIQNYTSRARGPMIAQQAQWVVDHRASMNTQFVVQLGDLVSTWDWAGHWPWASDGLKVLDDHRVPNAVVPGNHDFDNQTGSFAEYDQWFPVSRYANANWTPSSASYGGYLGQNQFGNDPVDRANMNNYSLFSAGGVDWLVLGLEWEASAPVLAWADRVLAAHPGRSVIMFTHSFLSLNGTRRTTPQRTGGTAPETLWRDFVRTHCQVRLVLSGHEHNGDLGESRRTDPNACGTPVHQILSNYQSRANGGNGWLRTYRFNPASGTVTAATYSPFLDQYETDADSAFTLPFDFAPAEPVPFAPVKTVQASSGDTVTATWTGLDRDTEYEWRARVSDGTDTRVSPTWTLRTPTADTVLHDTFSRTVASGWGTSTSGTAWSTTAPSSFSVGGGLGRISVPPGVRRDITASTVSAGDASILTSMAVTPAVTGSGTYAAIWSRRSAGGDYRAQVKFRESGEPDLSIHRQLGATDTQLATFRMPQKVAPGQLVNVRFDTVGTSPTVLRFKAWVGANEPSAWTLQAQDGTAALQTASGGLGYSVYTSGASVGPSTVEVDAITVTRQGTAPAPSVNEPPVAVITVTEQQERTVRVSAANSTDIDGTITGRVWDFGDGGTSTAISPTHTYAADGTYTITLTVIDDDGDTHTTTRSVTVAAAPPPAGARIRDDFGRNVTGGWGAADLGGTWATPGRATYYAVSGGSGQHLLDAPGVSAQSTLTANPARDGELRLDLRWSRTSAQGVLWAGLIPRVVTSNNDYRLKVNVGSAGHPRLDLVRRVGGTETILRSVSLTGVTVTAGTPYTAVVRAVTSGGTTTLSAKFFPAGATEPDWQVTSTDDTAALQAPGGIALWSYQSSGSSAPVTTAYDNLRLTDVTP